LKTRVRTGNRPHGCFTRPIYQAFHSFTGGPGFELPEGKKKTMKIIVPMAGMGKRMRPHTLTTPKPLLPVAGKPIVQRLVEDIAASCPEKVDEIIFIIGRFGREVEERLVKIAEELKAKGTIRYQDEALGTAHAILCAGEALEGKVVIAFADTLFRADFKFDEKSDGVVWVQKVEDPKQFGVVKIDNQGVITDFVEKPASFVSDLAIIGIYYIKDGANLRKELMHLIENNIRDKGEFQLTSALENMKGKGLKLMAGKVDEWLDCGNKDATVYTNQRVLSMAKKGKLVADSVKKDNALVIEPCYIGENVHLVHSVVGPYASIGDNSVIENCVIRNSIVQKHARLSGVQIQNSMIGNFAVIKEEFREYSMGDFCEEKE
jgi:glucose-1-phosphate thymidylyltransferase